MSDRTEKPHEGDTDARVNHLCACSQTTERAAVAQGKAPSTSRRARAGAGAACAIQGAVRQGAAGQLHGEEEEAEREQGPSLHAVRSTGVNSGWLAVLVGNWVQETGTGTGQCVGQTLLPVGLPDWVLLQRSCQQRQQVLTRPAGFEFALLVLGDACSTRSHHQQWQ